MFAKYENDAEVDVSEVYRYEDSAEVEAEAVYKYEDGAEVEAWSSAKELSAWFPTDPRDYDVTTNSSGTSYIIYKGASNYMYFTNWEEEFVNPTIKFSYEGGAWNGETTYGNYVEAGILYVVGIDEDGNETVVTIANVGKSGDTTGGDVEETLNGTFKEVGIKLFLKGSSSFTDNYFVQFDLYDITIDGKKYIAK